MSKLKELATRNEFLVLMTIIVLTIIISIINPAAFLTLANLFRILRSSIVIGIFAMGVLVVLISGGIDVSFPAIAVFALYATVSIMFNLGVQDALLAVFPEGTAYFLAFVVALILGALIGLVLGAVNAFFIAQFNLPTLIVTLGTLNAFRGFLLFFVGTLILREEIPQGMVELSRTNLLSISPPGQRTANLNISILILFAVTMLVWFILRYTMLGRGIYAIGGDREAAARAGFNIRRIQYFIYIFVGLLAGIGGIVFGSLARQANPFDIVGTELDVIAAVVLGGASISGGRGTVVGTLLGVLLITLVSSSLVIVGIPSEWQKVVVGVLILIGVAVPALQNRRTATPQAS
ncbi:MAG: ABC transporter permease [Chloroflexota bacterium]